MRFILKTRSIDLIVTKFMSYISNNARNGIYNNAEKILASLLVESYGPYEYRS